MASNQNTTTLGNYGTLALAGPVASPVLLKIYDFEWERMEEKVHRAYISGERDKFSFPNGYSGSFNFDRMTPAMENAFTVADAQMDANGTYQNWELTFQVNDPTGGGSTTLQFHGCALTISKGGQYRQNAVVTSTCHFESATLNYANNQ